MRPSIFSALAALSGFCAAAAGSAVAGAARLGVALGVPLGVPPAGSGRGRGVSSAPAPAAASRDPAPPPPPARKRKVCGGSGFQLRCAVPLGRCGRWRRWCCCGRGWRGPAGRRWLSSGGPFAPAPRSWRPLPIGALRRGRATVPPSSATAVPRLRPCTGRVSERSVSSCWVSFLPPTCSLDQPWTIRWRQPSLSMATGVSDRL